VGFWKCTLPPGWLSFLLYWDSSPPGSVWTLSTFTYFWILPCWPIKTNLVEMCGLGHLRCALHDHGKNLFMNEPVACLIKEFALSDYRQLVMQESQEGEAGEEGALKPSLGLEAHGSNCELPWSTGFRRSRRLGDWMGKLAQGDPVLEPCLVVHRISIPPYKSSVESVSPILVSYERLSAGCPRPIQWVT